MSFALLLQCFALVFCCINASLVPIRVQIHTEHKIFVRSTPSLDPAEELLEKFGDGNSMNISDMEAMFRSVGLAVVDKKSTQGTTSDKQACFSSQHFYGMYSRNDGTLNKTDLMELCPAVLYQMTKQKCHADVKKEPVEDEEETGKENPTRAWGFGFLFVTIISLGSLIGAFVVPLMDKPFYQKTLTLMVSLAVGVLGGSGVFHLIPNALGVPFDEDDQSYLWKCFMLFVGLYVFFALECAMKLYIRFKGIKKNELAKAPTDEKSKANGTEMHCIGLTDHTHARHDHNGGQAFPLIVVKNENHEANITIKNTKMSLASSSTSSMDDTSISKKSPIATVAWMIIIGDGLHNFIDGLAIGASFSGSVVMGISTSLAVVCEEIPHELGDFAILLNSGLSYKQAMVANFLSACCCYIGLVIGLVLGYSTHAVKYIYGVAGGMFLYIALVDMLPEALEMAYAISGNSRSKSLKMLCLVNFAIVFGFCVMLVIAFYGTSIEL